MIFAAAAFSFLVGGMVLPEPRFERRESFSAYEVSELASEVTTIPTSDVLLTLRPLDPEAMTDLDAVLVAEHGGLGEVPLVIAVYNCPTPRLADARGVFDVVALTCSPYDEVIPYWVQWQDEALVINGVILSRPAQPD